MYKNSISPGNFRLKIKSLKCYWVAIPIAAVWLSIILFYTRGGLLVGGDWAGYYNALAAFRTGAPEVITYGIGLLLAGENIYAGFYLWTFIGICLNLFALSFFLSSLFEEWRGRIVPLAIADVLFVFSMFSVYNTFKSVIALTDISIGGLLLFLALAVKLYRYLNKSGRFTKLDCVLMGIGIAVSSMVPPNSFRIIVVEGAIGVGLLFLAIVKQGTVKISNVKNVLKSFVFTVPLIVVVAVVGMLYWELSVFSSFKTYVGASLQAAQSFGLTTLNAPYANLINSFRILGVWSFQTGYCPYNGLFYGNPVVTIASFIWPIVVLGASLLLVKGSYRLKVLLLVALSLLIIVWDTANNPPVGALNLFVVSHVTFLSSFFPTFYLSGTLLPIIYVALSAFVAVRLIELLGGSKKFLRFRYKKFVMIIPLLLIVLLLVPDVPFFTGEALGQYFNSSVKGIWVPNDYFEVKDILSSSVQSGYNVLLWPSITTYVQTSWEYQGSNSFYNNFFDPLPVITPDSFGGYSLANPSLSAKYSTVTSIPITTSNSSSDVTSYADLPDFTVQGANYAYSNNTISLDSVNSSSDFVYIFIPFNETLNTSDFSLFQLQFSAGPQSLIETLLKNEGLWIGIGSSDGDIGWYIPGSTTASNYTVNNNMFTVSMVAGSPNTPWAASVYNPSFVNRIVFCIPTEDLKGRAHSRGYPSLDLSCLSINAFFDAVDQSTINLWGQYKVEYVLCDSSNVGGASISPEQYSSPLSFLINKGVIVPVFVGKYLQLYKVNYDLPS